MVQLKVQDETLVILRNIPLPEVNIGEICEMTPILCYNILYSLKKQFSEKTTGQLIFLELFNLDTYEVSKMYEKECDVVELCKFDTQEVPEMDEKECDDVWEGLQTFTFKYKLPLIIFNAFHYSLVTGNDLVNCS